ncbi:MAG: VWA domain-containing protein [Anaerolineales bacterium]|nr:VWA domain-containing protein [Anaerolineales bacterium]
MSGGLLVALALFATAGFAWLAYRLSLRWWPSLLIRLAVLGLVLAALSAGWLGSTESQPDHQILLVDLSDSVSERGKQTARSFSEDWLQDGENREVIVFGADADFLLSGEWPQVETGGTDLAGALLLAQSRLVGDPGRILIATDGQVSDQQQVDTALDEITAAGNTIQFIPLESIDQPGDVYLARVRGPDQIWPGTEFQLEVTTFSRVGGDAVLEVSAGENVEKIQLSLEAGENRKIIPLIAGETGVLPLSFRVVKEDDPFPANNTFYKSVRVLPQPQVLFVTQAAASAQKLIRSLEREGFPVTVISPAEFPRSVYDLQPYPAVFIHDILAQDLDLEQMQALELNVVQFGKSAIFIGGRNSFTLGGYQNTPLERLLPVILIPPTRVQRVPLTFLMVLDRSGSMAGDRDSEFPPIELTREAAMRAIETLRPDDYIGVLTFASTLNWDVPLAPVGDGLVLRTVQDKVSQIEAVGGTNMYLGLEEAVDELIHSLTTDYLHILLMSDGVSGDGSRQEFETLVGEARQRGVTISTIALGRESDPETLSAIAGAGGGRFYYVLEPVDLSTVMVDETRAVQTENVQEGRTNLILGIDNHPILSKIILDSRALAMEGYLAVQSKSTLGAEDVLLSGNFGDPILSVWQVGLGHTAAWMGDVGESWLPNLDTWPELGKFWRQVIWYSLPDPSVTEPEAAVRVEGDQVLVKIQLTQADRQALDAGSLRFLLPGMDGQIDEALVEQVGVSTFQAVFPRPADGAYGGVIQFTAGGVESQILVPFAVNYPEEWQFADPQIGEEQIEVWTQNPAAGKIELEAGSAPESARLETSRAFEILIGLLLVSWPLEVAIRRWRMPWRRP